MLQYRSKRTKKIYLTVKQSADNSRYCYVTTASTPFPYLVYSDNIEQFDPNVEKKMKLPMPKPRNKGSGFMRGTEWVNIKSKDPTWLYTRIEEEKKSLCNYQNADGLQMAVDYIGALQYRLDHLYD